MGISQEPKKAVIEKMRACGDWDRAKALLGAAHLLVSEAYLLHEDACGILRAHGLMFREAQFRHDNLRRAADACMRYDAQLLKGDAVSAYFHELDDFDRAIRRELGLDGGGGRKNEDKS